MLDLNPAAAEQAAQAIGDRALGIGGDVTDPAATRSAVNAAVEHFGGLDIAVANAGIAPGAATVKATPVEVFERVLEVNLMGVYRTVTAALPEIAARGGHMTLIGSVYSFMNGALVAPYAMSKAGVEALGRALRVELASHGASAGVAYYGFIATEMVRQGFEEDPLGSELEEQLPAFVRKRFTPEQAAAALVDGIEKRSPRVVRPAVGARILGASRGPQPSARLAPPPRKRAAGGHPQGRRGGPNLGPRDHQAREAASSRGRAGRDRRPGAHRGDAAGVRGGQWLTLYVAVVAELGRELPAAWTSSSWARRRCSICSKPASRRAAARRPSRGPCC